MLYVHVSTMISLFKNMDTSKWAKQKRKVKNNTHTSRHFTFMNEMEHVKFLGWANWSEEDEESTWLTFQFPIQNNCIKTFWDLRTGSSYCIPSRISCILRWVHDSYFFSPPCTCETSTFTFSKYKKNDNLFYCHVRSYSDICRLL